MDCTRTSGAADASRKRKRGALQDISNNRKTALPPQDVSQRRASLVKKETSAADEAAKPKAPRASTRRRSTTTATGLSTRKSSGASTAGQKTNTRVNGRKKTDALRAKKRKVEGNETQTGHVKVQTSMLSFQAAAVGKVKAKADAAVEKETVAGQEAQEADGKVGRVRCFCCC